MNRAFPCGNGPDKEETMNEIQTITVNGVPYALRDSSVPPLDGSLSLAGAAAEASAVGVALAGKQPKGDYVTVSALADFSQQEPLFAQTVDGCTDPTRFYVLPDGYIYAYMQNKSAYPAIEIEEGLNGYWSKEDGWTSTPDIDIYAKRTNLIPVTPGDVLRYKGKAAENIASVIWFDSDQTKLSSQQEDAVTTPIELTAPDGAAYVKFYSYGYVSGIENVVLEVSWVDCQAASEPTWQSTGHAFVPADYEDRIISLENWQQEASTALENNNTIIENHAINLLDLSNEMTELQEENLPDRTAGLEQSIEAFSANTAEVDKPVAFDWTEYGYYAQGSVGNTVTITSTGDDTGYAYAAIPVLPGEVYTVQAAHWWNMFAYAITDENTIILETDNLASGTQVWAELIIPTDAKYLYLNKYGFVSLTKKTAVSTAINDILYGKKIAYDGDSICYGAGYVGGYAKIIADKTYGKYDNQAVGGGILRSASALGKTNHSVVDNLANLPTDADLYCFEGGINDWWGTAELGTYTLNDFTGELDTTTICGALETIFRYALDTFIGKPICFIITHKIQGSAYAKNGAGNTFKDYRDAMVAICQKYSVPYYDAFSESGLNGWHSGQDSAFLTGNANNEPDGCHPNEAGYKRYYVPQLLSLFRKIMPVE